MNRIFSGMQPTGNLYLGNYLVIFFLCLTLCACGGSYVDPINPGDPPPVNANDSRAHSVSMGDVNNSQPRPFSSLSTSLLKQSFESKLFQRGMLEMNKGSARYIIDIDPDFILPIGVAFWDSYTVNLETKYRVFMAQDHQEVWKSDIINTVTEPVIGDGSAWKNVLFVKSSSGSDREISAIRNASHDNIIAFMKAFDLWESQQKP